jgi:hypothetical protein
MFLDAALSLCLTQFVFAATQSTVPMGAAQGRTHLCALGCHPFFTVCNTVSRAHLHHNHFHYRLFQSRKRHGQVSMPPPLLLRLTFACGNPVTRWPPLPAGGRAFSPLLPPQISVSVTIQQPLWQQLILRAPGKPNV